MFNAIFLFDTEKSLKQLINRTADKNFQSIHLNKIPNISESEQNGATSVNMIKCQIHVIKQTKKLLKKDIYDMIYINN